jgi:hypothetical protein
MSGSELDVFAFDLAKRSELRDQIEELIERDFGISASFLEKLVRPSC